MVELPIFEALSRMIIVEGVGVERYRVANVEEMAVNGCGRSGVSDEVRVNLLHVFGNEAVVGHIWRVVVAAVDHADIIALED
jgi:hypothetical protein